MLLIQPFWLSQTTGVQPFDAAPRTGTVTPLSSTVMTLLSLVVGAVRQFTRVVVTAVGWDAGVGVASGPWAWERYALLIQPFWPSQTTGVQPLAAAPRTGTVTPLSSTAMTLLPLVVGAERQFTRVVVTAVSWAAGVAVADGSWER